MDRLLFDLRTGDTAFVPAHWPLEILNSLLVAVRRGRIPREKIERFWSDLTALAIRVEPTGGWPGPRFTVWQNSIG